MNPFLEMLKNINASHLKDQYLRFTTSLKDQFSINHFWYCRITFSGLYSYVGTHAAWDEFCFGNDLTSRFPCIRHPDVVQTGMQLMKAVTDDQCQEAFQIAWEKFQINFNLNLVNKTPEGMEIFGFATCFNDPKSDERLLNDLPLLCKFLKVLRIRHQKLFLLIKEYHVDLPTAFGSLFYEQQKGLYLPRDRNAFLNEIGLGAAVTLTPREKDILPLVSHGYPASFIADQLLLSTKTIENYLDTIKSKLGCHSKVQLIQKAQEIVSSGFLNELWA